MFRPRPIREHHPSRRQKALLSGITSNKINLSGRSLPALPTASKTESVEQYLKNDVVDPFVVMKYENLKAQTHASRVTGTKGGRELMETLQERSSLQVQGATIRSSHSSIHDIPGTMSREGNGRRNGEGNDSKTGCGSSQSPQRKPTKLPSLVMMPSMVVGDVTQIRKLRRPSQVKNVKNVKVSNLIELRPLADEKDDTVSPSVDANGERAAAKRALARSLWFPVNEQNVNRPHQFMDHETGSSFENKLQARINSYIRNNNSPGCIRTALDFTKREVPNLFSSQLSEENANLRFHFSQLELEVGKSLKENGVSPTPTDRKTPVARPEIIDPVVRHSPVLLRKGLRDALKLPPDGCPRASMRSELVQAEGLKTPLKTLKLRSDYAKNLERNWMRRHMTEQRQKRKEKQIRITVGNWIGSRVNMQTQDFSRAFYSSDEGTDDEHDDLYDDLDTEIDDVIKTNMAPEVASKEMRPSTSGESKQRGVSFDDSSSPTRWSTYEQANIPRNSIYHPGFTTPLHTDDQTIADKSMLEGWGSQEILTEDTFETKPNILHRRRGYHEDAFSEASMEVQHSDYDVTTKEYEIEIVLTKEGDLYDRPVHSKRKRQKRRMRKRFESLVYPDSSEEEEEVVKEEQEIARMTDTELRAMRLKLNKQEDEDDDPGYTRNITSALLRDLSRLTSSASDKNKKKGKKKKKKPKTMKVDTMTVRERFLKDFGWLLNTKVKNRLMANKSIFSTTSSQIDGSTNGETEQSGEQENTYADIMKTIQEDLETLKTIDPKDLGFKKKEKKEKQKVLRRKKEFQKIYDEKMAAIRLERERERERKLAEAEKSGNPVAENEPEIDEPEPEEEINPEEWEYVTETDEDESDREEYIRARRNSVGGRSKPDTLIYDKLIEKPLPPVKPKSPLKSSKSSRSSKIGSPIKRSTPAHYRARLGSQDSIREGSIIFSKTPNTIAASPSMESIHKDESQNKSKNSEDAEHGKTSKRRGTIVPDGTSKRRGTLITDGTSRRRGTLVPDGTSKRRGTLIPGGTSQHPDEIPSDPDMDQSDLEDDNDEDDGFPKPRDGYFFDTELAEIDTRLLKRSGSWHGLAWDEEEISLHDLLEGIDVPAKEVKIQIVNRRRKRQRQKMEKQRQLEEEERKRNAQNQAEMGNNEEEVGDNSGDDGSTCDVSDNESTATTCVLSFTEDAPFLSAYLQWNRENKYKSQFTDQQLDEDIEDLSDLFWQMKDCRYIRWGKRDQAIITRLFELDLFDR